jgi:hypothetical protein
MCQEIFTPAKNIMRLWTDKLVGLSMDKLVIAERCAGLLGATSMVGSCLLPLLTRAGWQVEAFSRRKSSSGDAGVAWRVLDPALVQQGVKKIEYWVCVAPIWVLPQYFDLLEACGVRRVVALSSTSLFSACQKTHVF